jgi:hypothetical protein
MNAETIHMPMLIAQPTNIIVMSAAQAVEHIPLEPTLAKRIAEMPFGDYNPFPPLKPHRNWREVYTYFFDDIRPGAMPFPGQLEFGDSQAREMLDNYDAAVRAHPDITTLLVHCHAGQSRGPAVALAIKRIYGLRSPFTAEGLPYNKDVYAVLIKTAIMTRRISATDGEGLLDFTLQR